MIHWLNKKTIDFTSIEKYLKPSFEKNWFTNSGPACIELERVIRKKLKIDDSKSVIATSNGSHALHAIIAAIELVDGPKKYAVPSYTFPTNVQGNLTSANIIDVNDDFGLDVDKIKYPHAIDGIIVTNIFGHSQNIDNYLKWAELNNKLLIFDNAATPLTKYHGTSALNYGNASIVSFHHTKPLGFGEGGAVIIDNKYESAVRRVISFGFNEDRTHHVLGNNWKMSDVAASFILHHLEGHTAIFNHHTELYKQFYEETQDISGVELFPNHAKLSETFVSGLAVVFDKPISIEAARNLCNDSIDINKYYKPLGKPEDCVNAHNLYDRTLIYPCHMNMNETDVSTIVENIKHISNEQRS